MVFGIGIDIIETARVKNLVCQGRNQLDGIFTDQEVDYCSSKRYPEQHFAARFAAKEAFLKALGTGWRDGISFSDIEIGNDTLGKPVIRLNGKAGEILKRHAASDCIIHVSLSHVKQFATAMVIIETGE